MHRLSQMARIPGGGCFDQSLFMFIHKIYRRSGDDDDDDDDDSEEDDSEEEEEEEEEEVGEEESDEEKPELTRAQRKELKKKQAQAKQASKDEEEDDELMINPNRVQKNLTISDLNEPRQLSRRERYALVRNHRLTAVWRSYPENRRRRRRQKNVTGRCI